MHRSLLENHGDLRFTMRAFLFGFVLGTAFMASPAIGLALSALSAGIVTVNLIRK